jgi:hypothetical protein
METMNSEKKKDALTDLVDEAGAENNDTGSALQESEAVTPSGEVVTLGIDVDETIALAEKIVKLAKGGKFDKYK